MSAWFWSTLGIAETRDTRAIRRAYADQLKALDVDNDMDGFARLRNARDMALRFAAMPPPRPADRDYADDEEGEDDFFLGGVLDEEAVDSAYGAEVDPPEARPPESRPPEPAAPVEEPIAATPDHPGWLLQSILLPGGQYSDAGLTREDFDAATGHLDALLAEAHGATLDKAAGIDHALAEMLAESWPRSAPLVERANAEFGWLSEAGRLSERPALAFLNARTAGMRFHAEVQRSGHPMYEAWAELSRKGRPTFRDRRTNDRDRIFALISQVRENYPEVETYLDPERVEGWEHGPAKGEQWAYVVKLLGLLYLVGAGLLFMVDVGGERSEASPVAPMVQMVDPVSEEFPLAVNEVFGGEQGEYDPALLTGSFRSDLYAAFSNGRAGDPDKFADGVKAMRGVERSYLQLLRDDVDFTTLVQMQEVQRSWLRALKDSGHFGADCPIIDGVDTGLGDIALSREALDREAALLRTLVEQGKFASRPDGIEASNASVPGWAIDGAIRQSGLTEEQLIAALGNPSSPDRCRAMLGMLDAVLPRPGDVSIELLRIL